MAFELWPPNTPPMMLRRIDNIPIASPGSSAKSRKPSDLREMFRGLPAEERLKKFQEIQLAKNRSILNALENRRPRKSRRSSEVFGYKSYHDQGEGTLGCKHYQTNVSLSAPCCDEFYPCRFCHDERQPDHMLDRRSVNRLLCMGCGNVQKFTGNKAVDSKCEECNQVFAQYFCSICRFFDDSPTKEIFHCNDCGVCRVGSPQNFFHCKGCNMCISLDLKDKHKCLTSSKEADCPICANGVNDSQKPASILPCGHVLHTTCLEQYRKTNYRCPTCMKSFGEVQTYFAEIDSMMANSRMPLQYANRKASISCADCEKRSVVPYHFMYHKCTHCGSYNTNILEQLRA